MVSQNIRDSRTNKKFWILEHEFEDELKKGSTQEELDLLRPKYKTLHDLSFGTHHYIELRRLKDIFETKYELIPKTNNKL